MQPASRGVRRRSRRMMSLRETGDRSVAEGAGRCGRVVSGAGLVRSRRSTRRRWSRGAPRPGRGRWRAAGCRGPGAGTGAVPKLTAQTRPSPRAKREDAGRGVQPAQGALAELRQGGAAAGARRGTGARRSGCRRGRGRWRTRRTTRAAAATAWRRSAPEVKPNGEAVPGPGQRHPAAVADTGAAAGAAEDRVGEHVVGQVDDLGQAELLALVDVGGAGQRQHQQRGGAGAGGAESAALGGGLARSG